MTTHFEDIIRQNSQRLDDLKKTTEELQRELSEARVSLERELARSPRGHAALTEQIPVYPGPSREAFSAHAPVPAQGHYAEDPLPYYAEDSGPYYVAAGTPFAGEGPRYESTAGIGGPRRRPMISGLALQPPSIALPGIAVLWVIPRSIVLRAIPVR